MSTEHEAADTKDPRGDEYTTLAHCSLALALPRADGSCPASQWGESINKSFSLVGDDELHGVSSFAGSVNCAPRWA
eukprot:432113-Amphidinium_carterae.1